MKSLWIARHVTTTTSGDVSLVSTTWVFIAAVTWFEARAIARTEIDDPVDVEVLSGEGTLVGAGYVVFVSDTKGRYRAFETTREVRGGEPGWLESLRERKPVAQQGRRKKREVAG